jgi:hypothetical protein
LQHARLVQGQGAGLRVLGLGGWQVFVGRHGEIGWGGSLRAKG